MQDEAFWRNIVNGLDIPLPELGADPPVDEMIKPTKELVNGIDTDAYGNFSKLTIDVFFFMNPETNKYYMMQTQGITDYGEVQLKKAIEVVKRKQRRNKGTP